MQLKHPVAVVGLMHTSLPIGFSLDVLSNFVGDKCEAVCDDIIVSVRKGERVCVCAQAFCLPGADVIGGSCGRRHPLLLQTTQKSVFTLFMFGTVESIS